MAVEASLTPLMVLSSHRARLNSSEGQTAPHRPARPGAEPVRQGRGRRRRQHPPILLRGRLQLIVKLLPLCPEFAHRWLRMDFS
jgi:hypothetical protein